MPVELSDTRGGALLVKAGAIIPTWPPCDTSKMAGRRSRPAGLPPASCAFTHARGRRHELNYRKGAYAQTRLTCETAGKKITLTVGGRKGKYAGMPVSRDFTASVRLPAKPAAVALDGAAVAEFGWDEAARVATVKIPACGEKPRVLTLE
jgi:hypothetical protein